MDEPGATRAPMDMSDSPPEASPRLRSSRRLAIAGFLLAATSALLAWWGVTWSSGGTAIRDDVRLFRPEEPLTTSWGPWLTGALVAVAVLVLFVRIAARSEKYEPATWRRDVGIAAGLVVLALGSGMLWPAEVPSFWGGRTYEGSITDGEPVTETATPGLGWWVALVAAATLIAAWAKARPQAEPA